MFISTLEKCIQATQDKEKKKQLDELKNINFIVEEWFSRQEIGPNDNQPFKDKDCYLKVEYKVYKL